MNDLDQPDTPEQTHIGDGSSPSRVFPRTTRRGFVIAAASITVVALATAGIVTGVTASHPVTATSASSGPNESRPVAPETATTAPPVPSVAPDTLAGLPDAVYDAVVPGLMRYDDTQTSTITQAWTAAEDVPVFGADRATPVAKIPATNFLLEPTVIVPVSIEGDWAEVLTPSRSTLPSTTGGDAAAQTTGWVPAADLSPSHALDSRVEVSVSAQTLTIIGSDGSEAFPIGVGAGATPTPVGTTGYLQARYDDPTQAQFTIQLTTLHSSAADEPFGGSDGGLIGIHYNTTNTGEVSHGCIRLTYAALRAVNDLPLGTPIVMLP